MICNNCGNELKDNSKFCDQCGIKAKKRKNPSNMAAIAFIMFFFGGPLVYIVGIPIVLRISTNPFFISIATYALPFIIECFSMIFAIKYTKQENKKIDKVKNIYSYIAIVFLVSSIFAFIAAYRNLNLFEHGLAVFLFVLGEIFTCVSIDKNRNKLAYALGIVCLIMKLLFYIFGILFLGKWFDKVGETLRKFLN